MVNNNYVFITALSYFIAKSEEWGRCKFGESAKTPAGPIQMTNLSIGVSRRYMVDRADKNVVQKQIKISEATQICQLRLMSNVL